MKQMKEREISPDSVTFLSLLRCCGGPRLAGLVGGPWAMKAVAARVAAVEQEMMDQGIEHTKETMAEIVSCLSFFNHVESCCCDSFLD